MFTGLIEETGEVLSLNREGTNLHIEIGASLILEDAKLGDSIAVDGVCLTVTELNSKSFKVTAIDETLKLTTLGNYTEGTKVNLERCLRPADRLGGHIVAGHVDCLATVKEVKELDGSWEYHINVPGNLAKYFIYKGSVAINGISLTVASCTEDSISVAIIPETHERTNISELKAGSKVNIEVDMLAKYIEKQVSLKNC